MKVLYIGYYREKSDWGRQTVNNILALERAGVDVVCRCVELGSAGTPIELLALENKDADNCDVCIQHVFPEHMVGTEKFKKNVGVFANNFVNIEHSSWVEKLNLMDEVWVPSTLGFNSLPESLRKKAAVVPFAIDTSVFNKRYRDLTMPEVDNDFKFYTVCSPSELTGLEWVIASFHSEFDISDATSLVIQIDAQGDGSKELKMVEELSLKVKSLLRLHASPEDYKKDVIIASPGIDQEDLFSFHQYCDCYVSCNTGVTFVLSEVNAAGFGNTPIVSSKSSVCEYIGDDSSVDSIYQTLQIKSSLWKDVNGKDFWVRPDESQIKKRMREAFENEKSTMQRKLDNKRQAIEKLSEVSLEAVGQKMKEQLSV